MGNASNSLKDFLWSFKKNKKAQITILVVVLIILVVAIAYFLYISMNDGTDVVVVNENTNSSVVDKIYRRYLDGKSASLEMVNPKPVSVMVENLVSVRPQSGISSASVVYEALAEGGITRFMLVFAGVGSNISEIGPVRSARPYFVDFADEYESLYVHCGGSPQALNKIPSTDITSINQIGGDHSYYWRDISKSAPHNLYTSGELLARALRDYDLDDEGDFEPWKFKDDEENSSLPVENKTINIDYSTYSYAVEWKYAKEDNTYTRYNGGEIHLDNNNNLPIKAKNIVVQKTETGILDDVARLDIETAGDGEAIIFQDGRTTIGTWEKKSNRTVFFDDQGDEIRFNAGQIWVEIVKTNTPIDYN